MTIDLGHIRAGTLSLVCPCSRVCCGGSQILFSASCQDCLSQPPLLTASGSVLPWVSLTGVYFCHRKATLAETPWPQLYPAVPSCTVSNGRSQPLLCYHTDTSSIRPFLDSFCFYSLDLPVVGSSSQPSSTLKPWLVSRFHHQTIGMITGLLRPLIHRNSPCSRKVSC